MRTIGLDFGTSTTYVAEAQRLLSKNIAIGLNGFLPSLAQITDSGQLRIADEVNLEEPNVIRSIKSVITNSHSRTDWDREISSDDGRHRVSASSVINGLLALAAREVQISSNSDVKIRMGCPSSWNGAQRLALLDCAKRAGLAVSPSDLIDEPVAAISSWFFSAKHAGELPSRAKREEVLRVALLDMGGGTMDIALVDVRHWRTARPELRVLSSIGNAMAGDVFDDALVAALSDQAKTNDPNLYEATQNFPLSFRVACRELKHDLGAQDQVRAIKYIGKDRFRMVVTQETMRRAFEGLFLEVWAMLIQASREAKLTETSKALSHEVLHRFSEPELLSSLDAIVISGGMAHLHVFRDRLEQQLQDVSASLRDSVRIYDATDELADSYSVDKSVSLGLGLGQEMGRVNYHRPQFSLYLELEERDGSRFVVSEPVYDAFATLQQFDMRTTPFAPLAHQWRFSEHVPERFMGARAWLIARNLDGSTKKFKRFLTSVHVGEKAYQSLGSEGIPFEIRPSNFTNWSNDLIQVQSSGRILIKSGLTHLEIRVPDWPAETSDKPIEYEMVDPRGSAWPYPAIKPLSWIP